MSDDILSRRIDSVSFEELARWIRQNGGKAAGLPIHWRSSTVQEWVDGIAADDAELKAGSSGPSRHSKVPDEFYE